MTTKTHRLQIGDGIRYKGEEYFIIDSINTVDKCMILVLAKITDTDVRAVPYRLKIENGKLYTIDTKGNKEAFDNYEYSGAYLNGLASREKYIYGIATDEINDILNRNFKLIIQGVKKVLVGTLDETFKKLFTSPSGVSEVQRVFWDSGVFIDMELVYPFVTDMFKKACLKYWGDDDLDEAAKLYVVDEIINH